MFNSDFGSLSEKDHDYIWDKKLNYHTWQGSLFKYNVRTEGRKLISNFYKEFLDIVFFLKKLSKNKQIIIRLHPGENKFVWRSHFINEKNIKIIDPVKDVTPWILACDALLHRGCITSLQSLVMKKPTYWISFKDKNNYKNKLISFRYSEKIILNSKKIELDKINFIKKNRVNKYLLNYLGITKKDAADRIAEIFSSYKINKEKRIKINKNNKILDYYYFLIILFKRYVFKFYKFIFLKNEISIQLFQKIPSNIDKIESTFYLSKLIDVNTINIENVMHNVVLIEESKKTAKY